MKKQLLLIVLVTLAGCNAKQPVAPPSQQTPAVHPNKRIRAEINDFMTAALKTIDADALNASENKRLAVFAYGFGAITQRVQDEGLQPVDAHAQALILYCDLFQMSHSDSAKIAQTMIDKTADHTWMGLMEEGAKDMQDWTKSGGKEPPKRLAALLSSTIPDLKGTLGQGPPPVKSEMQNIVSPEDLRKMLAAQHAVVFVDVDWSMYSVHARRHVQGFIEAWNQQNPGSVVTFYRLNLTEQEGVLWDAVGQWLQAQSVPRQIMTAGAGSLIWVSNGKVDHSLLNAVTAKPTELIETTRRTFKEPAASAHDKKQEGKNP
jgi:hypothetical protein